MPDLKISDRHLSSLETFILGTDGIVDQVEALRRLEILVASHEQAAVRAARVQWMKDEQAAGVQAKARKPLGPPPPPGPKRGFIEHPPVQAPVLRPRLPSRSAPPPKKSKKKARTR